MKPAVLIASVTVVSAALLIIVTSAHAAPPPSANLVLWLKADNIAQANNSAVGSWADSSPSPNSPTQANGGNRPTFTQGLFGYHAGVTFDGDDYLHLAPRISFTAGAVPGVSYFAVMRTVVDDTTTSYGLNPPQTLIGDNTGNIENGFGVHGAFANYVAAPAVSMLSTTVVNDGSPHIIEVTHDLNNVPGAIKLYVGGVLEPSGSTNPNAAYGITLIGGGINLADWNTANPTANDFFRGDVAEILVYNTALSDANRQAVESYLYDTYFAPEPASAALLALGAVTVLRRRPATR